MVSRAYSEKVLQGHIDLIKKSKDILKKGWVIEREGVDVYVTLFEWKNDGTYTKHMLRLRCDDYPVEAPSAIFINPKTKHEDVNCWPAGHHFYPKWQEGFSWICFNKLREFNKVYPGQCTWNGRGHAADTILDIITKIKDMIDYK